MPVGVGIIGTNWGGKVQTSIFRAAGLEVVAIYSRSKRKAQEMCEQQGIRHAFDSVEELCACPDVQVVSVTSPTFLHAEHAIAALRAGKHVLSDKPAGASVAEVEAMVRAAREQPGAFAIIDHEMRFTPSVAAARKAILEDGLIGDVRHFDLQALMNFGSFGPNHVWWNDLERGGGIMGAVGVHLVDQLHFLLGQKVTGVQAMTETFVKEKRVHPKEAKTEEEKTRMVPCTAEEYVAAQFRCDRGALGSFTLTGVMAGHGGSSLHINGTTGSASLVNGKLTVRNAKGKKLLDVEDGRLPEELAKVAGNHAGAPALGTFNIATAIKSYVEDGSKGALSQACTFEDGLYNQKVLAAIISSSRAERVSKL